MREGHATCCWILHDCHGSLSWLVPPSQQTHHIPLWSILLTLIHGSSGETHHALPRHGRARVMTDGGKRATLTLFPKTTKLIRWSDNFAPGFFTPIQKRDILSDGLMIKLWDSIKLSSFHAPGDWGHRDLENIYCNFDYMAITIGKINV